MFRIFIAILKLNLGGFVCVYVYIHARTHIHTYIYMHTYLPRFSLKMAVKSQNMSLRAVNS